MKERLKYGGWEGYSYKESKLEVYGGGGGGYNEYNLGI